jgi:hypothetical protein
MTITKFVKWSDGQIHKTSEFSRAEGSAKPRLQVWVRNPRASECAGLDYSQDVPTAGEEKI